ncbi:MAG: hypothetical protein ACO2PO_20780, partial [Candidatus Calescibacterium sp.]
LGMQKFKSLLKKLFFIFAFPPIFLSFLFLGCKGKEIKPDDFSSGLANRDPKLAEGLLYIETENIYEAKNFFKNLGKENPHHCGYLIGLPLVQIQEYLAKLLAIVNFVVRFYESELAQTTARIHPTLPGHKIVLDDASSAKLLTKQSCDKSLDRLIREFVSSLHTDAEEGTKMLEQAISQKCEIDINYPLNLSIGNSFSLHLVLYGRMGEAEFSFLNYIGYFVLTISSFILAHDYSANTFGILQNIKKIDTQNIIGLLRTLAFLVEECNKTFLFYQDGQKYIRQMPNFITNSIEAGLSFLRSLESRGSMKQEEKEKYAIVFYDKSGEGRIGYNPYSVTIASPSDEIEIKLKGKVIVGNTKAYLSKVKIKVPYIISLDFVQQVFDLSEKIKKILQEGKSGCPDNCISVADFNFFLEALKAAKFDDFLRFDIVKYFQNPKPIRDLLPYWFKNEVIDKDGNPMKRWEFIIEAEVPPSRKDNIYYLFNFDSPHFVFPSYITFYGRQVSDYTIPTDCVFIESVPYIGSTALNWFLIPYLNVQDPSLGGILYVRLKNTNIPADCSAYEVEYISDEWKHANLYMFNKSLGIIVQKAGSIISPLANIILQSISAEQ